MSLFNTRFNYQINLLLGILLSSNAAFAATDYDYDGDGIADIAVRRASNYYWYIQNSGDDNFNSAAQDGIQRIQFGKQSTDIPVPADYDGDGITDIAVRRPATYTWYVKNSSGSNYNSSVGDGIQRVVFGKQASDIPVPADYDGDNIADFAVRRPSTYTWYILNSSGSNFNSDNQDGIQRIVFGKHEDDIPVKGDFNGDGIDDIAVRRASNYTWYIRNSDGGNYNSGVGDGIQRVVFGKDVNDIPVPADYDGDGITDIAVRRPATYTWYILQSSDGEIKSFVFGKNEDDIPVPADYDGDGKADIAVRRDGNQYFYILNSSDGEIQRINFGKQSDDIPANAPVTEITDKLNTINDTGTNSNSAPVADAGADLTVSVGDLIQLDGSNSSDADGDSLSYNWSVSSIPEGSEAALSDNTVAMPTFIADAAGDFVFSLTVHDGSASSTGDLVTITALALNNPPVADAGADQSVIVGQQVQLDGSASFDADGDTLTYSWSLSSVPEGSQALLSNSTSTSPTITADTEGEYLLQLVVNDGLDVSQDTVTITANAAVVDTGPDFYTPAPIVDILSNDRSIEWVAISSAANDLMRFTFGPASTDDVFIINDDNNVVESSLGITASLAADNSSSDEVLLRSMFKLIAEGSDTYRIVSTKHSNYALDRDVDSDAVILRDYRSGSRDDDNAGYLVFSLVGTSPLTLSAVERYRYDSESVTFVSDASWTEQSLLFQNDSLQLSSTSSSEFYFYEPPIDFDIPFDFNPEQIERVSNDELTPITKDGDLSGLQKQIAAEYAAQVATAGVDEATHAAAETMLTTIQDTLESEGATMRYSSDFYLTVREGMLSRIYESSDSTDGQLGQNTIPFVYFTNEMDDDGVHHPFMVIASYGLPDSLTLLWDVPKPPGGGDGATYDEQQVTRSVHKELFLIKVPIRDYGEVDSLTENNMENDLASDVGSEVLTHHTYASVSSTGVAIDGVLIYPSYNNSLHVSQNEAELSAHGMHSGRGLGAHYHADAFSAYAKGLNMYNIEDYEGHTHPPIISMGFDGIAGYGIYLEGDTSSDGVDVALDDFGGHEHGDYGYHYHSYAIDAVSDKEQVSYKAHQLPPFGAWSGRINDIPEFWDGTAPNVIGGRSKWLGND